MYNSALDSGSGNGEKKIFITMAKEGSTISGLMDAFATAVSFNLQYGVPFKFLVDKFVQHHDHGCAAVLGVRFHHDAQRKLLQVRQLRRHQRLQLEFLSNKFDVGESQRSRTASYVRELFYLI